MKKCLFPLDAYMVLCQTWSKNLGRTLLMVITYRNYLEEYLLCALYILCNHTGHQGECLFFVISRRFFYKSYNFCNQHAICLSTFKICFSFQINARLFKGGFFQKVWCVFQFSKKYSKLLSWTWNLNFPPITVNNKFKFQAQDGNLEYFYFGDLKNESHFLKKATFKRSSINDVRQFLTIP